MYVWLCLEVERRNKKKHAKKINQLFLSDFLIEFKVSWYKNVLIARNIFIIWRKISSFWILFDGQFNRAQCLTVFHPSLWIYVAGSTIEVHSLKFYLSNKPSTAINGYLQFKVNWPTKGIRKPSLRWRFSVDGIQKAAKFKLQASIAC